MSKLKTLMVLAAWTGLSTFNTAIADDAAATTGDSKSAQPIAANPSQAAVSKSPQKSASNVSFPKKVLGVVVGTVVGIPVCLVRRPYINEKYGVSQLTGDSDQPRVMVPAALWYVGFATAAGVFEAPWVAFTNSFANADKPFSKAQFSLTEPTVEPNPKPEPQSR